MKFFFILCLFSSLCCGDNNLLSTAIRFNNNCSRCKILTQIENYKNNEKIYIEEGLDHVGTFNIHPALLFFKERAEYRKNVKQYKEINIENKGCILCNKYFYKTDPEVLKNRFCQII